MANIGDLEVFRQKWREELNKKQNVEREEGDDSGGSNIQTTSKNQNVTVSPNSVNIKFNDNIISSSSKPDNSNHKPEVAYYPFDIVCNLLKFDKKNLQDQEDLDIIPVVKGKQKRHIEQQPKNNTVKKVKLKDIFSDRVNQSDGFARERILDKFISDLVRY